MSRRRSGETAASSGDADRLSSIPSSSVVNHNIEHNLIKKLLENMKVTIEGSIERINTNAEGVDEETIARWRQQLETVIKTLQNVDNKDKVMDPTIREVLGKYLQMDIETLVEVDETQIIEETRTLAASKASSLPNDKYKAMLSALQPANEQQDEDLVIQDDTGMTDNKIRCPYTTNIMEEPMKNEGPKKCIHHISRQGLQQITRQGGQGKCPIPGCQGRWALNTSVVDEAFKLKIERYLRRKELESQLLEGGSRGGGTAVDIDEDEEA